MEGRKKGERQVGIHDCDRTTVFRALAVAMCAGEKTESYYLKKAKARMPKQCHE